MIQYSVRPITRYIITRYHADGDAAGVETKGEYDSARVAYEVAYALCKAEHDAAKTEPDDMNFIYPDPKISDNLMADGAGQLNL